MADGISPVGGPRRSDPVNHPTSTQSEQEIQKLFEKRAVLPKSPPDSPETNRTTKDQIMNALITGTGGSES